MLRSCSGMPTWETKMTTLTRRAFLADTSKGLAFLTCVPTVAGGCSLDGCGSELSRRVKSDRLPRFGSRRELKRGQGTGYVFDERCLDHAHPVEQSKRLIGINKALSDTGIVQHLRHLKPIADPIPYIREIHSEAHVERVRKIPRTGPASELAVAGVLSGVQAVLEGRVKNAFCAVRPPGHHAHNAGQEEGFCFFGNVAIAARYAQAVYGLRRILIIDWDYHHGNGTEWAFYRDRSVYFFSTHDWHAYPGTGDPRRRGEGPGLGYNLNIHMACQSGDDQFFRVYDEKLLSAAETFKPELILISAGFDSQRNDLLGCFDITPAGFKKLTRKVTALARTCAGGRLVSVLEGGYADRDHPDLNTYKSLASSAAAHVSALVSDG